MSVQQNKALVQRYLEEIYNKGNLELVEKFVTEDYVCHGAPPGTPPGPDAVKAHVSMIRDALPDSRHTVVETIAEDDKVVQQWINRGIHRGELMGIPATGSAVEFGGITIYRIRDGKIMESWDQVDLLGLMQQIGVAPVSAST